MVHQVGVIKAGLGVIRISDHWGDLLVGNSHGIVSHIPPTPTAMVKIQLKAEGKAAITVVKSITDKTYAGLITESNAEFVEF